MRTRRELLAAAAGAGALGGGAPAAVAAAGPPPVLTEPQTLQHLLGIELLQIFVYERALAMAPLSPRVVALVRRVLGQDRVHARLLGRELALLGVPSPSAPVDSSAADQQVRAHSQVPVTLAKARTEHEWLRLLVGLERVSEGAYYLSMASLVSPSRLRLAAQIMGNDAQHTAWLADHLHHGKIDLAVPDSFVQGIP